MALDTSEVALALGQLMLDRMDLTKRLDEAEKKIKNLEQAKANKNPEGSPPVK